MDKNKYLNQIYKKNTETKNYVIELKVDNLSYIFNDWDSANFKRRDVDPELIEFLEDCSSDIPLRFGIELNFNVLNGIKDLNKEKQITLGIKNHLNYLLYVEQKAIKKLLKKIITCIIIGFLLIACSLSWNAVMSQNIIGQVLDEGVNVGGWVFLWEAVYLLFFEIGLVRTKTKEYARLVNAPIYFDFKNSNEKEISYS